MKKNISIILMITLALVGSTNTVLAQGKSPVSPQISQSYTRSPGEEGTVIQFNSVDDETGIANTGFPVYTKQASGTIWSYTWYAGSNVKVVEKAVATGDSKISKRFVRYLTGSWAKAEKYTWSKSNSASWTISPSTTVEVANGVKASLGLSSSRTTTYSVAVSIPANKARYSKLGFASDYFKQNYKYTMTVNGSQTQSHNGYIETPTKDSYLIVYYQ